jgi:imidazolonepropionase-like amidohydrolase
MPLQPVLTWLRAAIIAGVFAPAAASPQSIAITNVTVIDATGAAPRAGQTVLVDSGRIIAIGPAARTTPPVSATVVDGRGKFLIPGLCDAHVHFYHGDRMLAQFLAHGVTCVHDMWGETSRMAAWRREIDVGERVGPSILTVAGGWPDAGDTSRAQALVDSLVALGADFIKVGSPEPEWYRALGRAARARGLRVIGHLPSAVPVREVMASGQSRLEHVAVALLIATSTNADSLRARWVEAVRRGDHSEIAAIQREAIVGQQRASRASLFQEMIARGVAVTPTLVNHRASAMLADSAFASDPRLRLFDDTTRQAWSDWHRRQQRSEAQTDAARVLFEAQRELVRDLFRAGVIILAGSDAGDHYRYYGASLHDEMELLASSGLPPMAVLQAATRHPAAYLGRLAERGTVEVGRRADLVLLGADPLADIRNVRRVEAVVHGGRLLDAPALARLRAGATP